MKYVGENALKKWTSLVKSDIKKKLDKNQGTANSGKILGVDASGEVAPTDTEVATLVDVPNGIVKGDGSTLSAAVAGTDYMTPPTGGTAGQILKKTETGTEWADAPVPDWNQNDSTAADYVKNRPFYTGDPVETVLVEESTVTFTDNNGIYLANFPSTFEATVGETYKISWDGTIYECVCLSFQSNIIIGNLSIVNDSFTDTGEPFAMAIINGGINIGTADTSSSHTFSISKTDVPVVKIDPKYLPASFKPDGKSYLTFSSPDSFTLAVNDATKHWDGTLEYFASDRTWTTWDGTTTLFSIENSCEYVLYLRGTGNTKITGLNASGHPNDTYKWVLTGSNISCIGNIENLLDYATVESENHPTMANGCYSNMFQDCKSLTQAPTLPAITLAVGCYNSMFSNCTSLTQAPALPAITLANSCYRNMFQGCTSLTQAQALPAITLASSCYRNMFQGCQSLTQAPALPATTLAESCYNNMFFNCTSLKLSSSKTGEYTQEYRIPSSGTGTTATNALTSMFSSTGGTFTGEPGINTTYYLSSDNMIVRETEISTLNGYVGSMIKELATQEYVDGKVPDGGSTGQVLTKTADGQEWQDREKDLFIVTISVVSNTTYTVDKTFLEIQEAYDAGKVCFALMTFEGKTLLPIVQLIKDTIAAFSASSSDINFLLMIHADNSIEVESKQFQKYITITGLLKGNGSGSVTAAVAGTDYMAPPTGGTVGQVLTKTANSSEWADAPKSLPDGGTAGDALVKSTDGGSWETPVEASLVDLPVITASQTDLTAGTSPLATGELYVVYE